MVKKNLCMHIHIYDSIGIEANGTIIRLVKLLKVVVVGGGEEDEGVKGEERKWLEQVEGGWDRRRMRGWGS